jgi:hypothetical protein
LNIIYQSSWSNIDLNSRDIFSDTLYYNNICFGDWKNGMVERLTNLEIQALSFND